MHCRTTRRWLRVLVLVLQFPSITLQAQDAGLIPEVRSDLANATDDTLRADALARLCFNLIQTFPDSARYYGEAALALAERIGQPRALADAHNNLGWLETSQGNFKEAEEHFKIALDLFIVIGNPAYIAVTLSNMGWCAAKQGNRVGALTQFQNALKQSENAQDTAIMAVSLYSIGTTYSKMKEYDRARDHIERSMQMERMLGRKSKEANCLLAIGNIWRSESNTSKALELYEQASLMYAANNDQYGVGMVEENSGDLFIDDRPGAALTHYTKSLQVYEALHSPADKAYILQRIGLAQQGMKRYTDAEQSYGEGMTLAKSTGSTELVMEFELSLAELAVDQGRSEIALEHYQRHMALKDSLQSDASQRELLRLRTVFETEKAEQDNELLKTENELRRTNERRLKARALGIAAFAVLLTLVLGMLWRTYRLREKHTKEVEAFNTELAKQRDEVERINSLLELKVLRSQLNPHFIYNCQSSAIAMMKAGQTVEALAYLQGFARLLRMMLEHSVSDCITVEEEADFLRQYIKLEALRVTDLHYEVNVDPVLIKNEADIPALLVQPFVENALWHGLAQKSGVRELVIDFKQSGTQLHCTITDNGIGRNGTKATGDDHHSLGTELINERLQLLTHRLDQRGSYVIEDLTNVTGEPCGTQVTLQLEIGPAEKTTSTFTTHI